MLAKRIIPCLDVKNGRNVRGVKFSADRDAGDPVELATRYDAEGADELVFYDITASADGRAIVMDLVQQVSEQVFIPLTVGGGIRTFADVREILKSGADKVSINSAAVENPDIINESAESFGSQCIVGAIDALRTFGGDEPAWEIYVNGGRKATGLDALDWVEELVDRGAGRTGAQQHRRRRNARRVRPRVEPDRRGPRRRPHRRFGRLRQLRAYP